MEKMSRSYTPRYMPGETNSDLNSLMCRYTLNKSKFFVLLGGTALDVLFTFCSDAMWGKGGKEILTAPGSAGAVYKMKVGQNCRSPPPTIVKPMFRLYMVKDKDMEVSELKLCLTISVIFRNIMILR